MNKRYQVFISSTYSDLKDERQKVIQTIMEMDCIPAGMELFPAADEEQWEFIKKVINDCDYYLLIIGGRYGSLDKSGISYTEKEFDYAVEKGIRVVALIHEEPDQIPFGKSEQDPSLRQLLLKFIDKVKEGRLVKFWKDAEQLPGLVSLSLTKTITTYPAIGWVRANQVASEDLLKQINALRNQNDDLITKIQNYEKSEPILIDDLASIDSCFQVNISYTHSRTHTRQLFKVSKTWREYFCLIAPFLYQHPNQEYIRSKLSRSLYSGSNALINEQDFLTLTLQFKAYGLIQTKYSQTVTGGMALFWSLTDKGEQLMLETRVVRES